MLRLVCLCKVMLVCDNVHTLYDHSSMLLNLGRVSSPFISCNSVTSARLVEGPEDN